MAANRYDWTLLPELRAHVRRSIHNYSKDELGGMLIDMLDLLDAAELRVIRERDLQKRTEDAMESLLGRSKKGTGEN